MDIYLSPDDFSCLLQWFELQTNLHCYCHSLINFRLCHWILLLMLCLLDCNIGESLVHACHIAVLVLNSQTNGVILLQRVQLPLILLQQQPVLRPLYRSTCISRHLQLEDFVGAKFFCLHVLANIHAFIL